MDKVMNSPFRYPGGKFYARKLILEHIPWHEYYIEPFAGGASIFFAKGKVEENWLNDIDEGLMNCFTIIRDGPDDLIRMLEGEKATKKRHRFYKEDFVPGDELEEAVRWYYLNRTSYSGIMNLRNCYWGYGDKYSMRPENWGRNIRRTSEKLQGVRLTRFDFEVVIDEIVEGGTDKVFLFVDPPYFNADQDKFYTHAFTREDHLRLCEVLRKYNGAFKFLLTYDNSPEVWELYEWADAIYEKEWNYTINRTDDQRKGAVKRKGNRYKGKEIFIVNYEHESPKQLQLF